MRSLLFLFLSLSGFVTLSAQFTYSGVLGKADADCEYAFQLSWGDFQQRHEALDSQGFQLVDIETAKSGARRYYWGIWKKSELHSTLKRIESWDSLVIMKRQMAADSFVLDEIEAYTYGGKDYFLAVWIPGMREHKIRKLSSWEGLVNDHENLSRLDLQLVDIECFEASDTTQQYLALYQWDGPEFRTYFYRSHDFDDFITDKGYRQKSGYNLFDYERFEKRGQVFYTGLYKGGISGRRLEDHYSREDLEKLMAEQEERHNILLMDVDVYTGEAER